MSDERDTDNLARLLREEARAFAYPPTPDLARRIGRPPARPAPRATLRRLAPVALAVALLAAALLAVPEVRAAALRLLQVGAVRVRVEPAPPPTALPTAGAPATAPAPTASPPSPAPHPGLSGETTLAEAERRVAFPVRLPVYPEGLGPPDRVFLQELDGDALILVWQDPAAPGRPLLSLHALSSDVFAQKTIYGAETERLAEAEVGGAPALWVRGAHLLQVGRAGEIELAPVRIVEGNTLIWTAGGLTYRLESELTLEEALRVAESLR
ncbi:MAG TPA: hypothetical protein PKD53_09630 [Chloroflexaceae bacterium]|nr:hypothetical protein [Chloroflexaceae bacterium]